MLRGLRKGTAGWPCRGAAEKAPDLGPPGDRARAALGLERQIQDADRVIRGFETTVAQEAPIPAGPGALQDRVSELQVRGRATASPSIHGRVGSQGDSWNPEGAWRRVLSSPSACGGSCWNGRPACWGCTGS